MGNKKVEEKFDLDMEAINEPLPRVAVSASEAVIENEAPKKKVSKKFVDEDRPLVSCLRNEKVIVRHIPRVTALVQNPKHELYGGMAPGAIKRYTVPRLTSGQFVNVLTDNEKAYLEEVMGLEPNAMSVYNRENNFWDDSNPHGISTVTLTKQDTYLDLSQPEQYIKYKILLANKNNIAPSLQALEDAPKATYEFVIIEENAAERKTLDKMKLSQKAYVEYGKIENNFSILRQIIETIDSRPISRDTKLDWLQSRVWDFVTSDPKLFTKLATDPLLPTKAMIGDAVEGGIISKRGNYYYYKKDNTPLCENNEEPTLNMAAKYLNAPKHQELLLTIQAQVKD